MNNHFSREFRGFLRHLVSWRARMIQKGVSQRNEAEMRNLVSMFTPYTAVNFNEVGSARFIIRHYDELMKLIPSNAEIVQSHLNELHKKASEIIEPKLEMI